MANATERHPRQAPTKAQKEAAYDRLIRLVESWPDPVEAQAQPAPQSSPAPQAPVNKLSSPEVKRRVSRAYDAIERSGEVWEKYKQEHPEVV